MATETLIIRITGDARGVQKASAQAKASLAGVAKESQGAGSSFARSGKEADAQTRRFSKLRGAAGGLVGSFKSLATTAGAIGVAGALVKMGQATVGFDRAMRNVNSLAQLSEKRLKSLERQVLKLAGKTAQAPETLAKGLYDLVSSGFDARDSMRILASSAKAATAGLTSTEISTKAVAAVLNAYHQPASKAADVSDVLFQTVNRGVVTFEELSTSIGDVLPFASSLGVSLREVGASTATMTKAGISAPETMTRIKNVMVSMLKPGEGLKNAFKDLGVESGEALIKQRGFQGALDALVGTTDGSKKAVAALFPNIRALGGALALTGRNSRGAAKDLDGMRTAAGATDKALRQQSKSISFQWNKLKAEATALAITYGGKLVPSISKVIKTLSDPKLTTGEKFQKLGDMIVHAFGKAAPAAVRAFFNAFQGMPLWGKLLTGAFLIRKLGLVQAFGGLGRTAGGSMAESTATTFAGRLKGRMRGIGKAVVGTALLAGIADAVTTSDPGFSFGDRFQKAASTATLGLIPSPKTIDERMQTIVKKIQESRSQLSVGSIIKGKDITDFDRNKQILIGRMAGLRNTANRMFGPGTHLLSSAWSNPKKASADLQTYANNVAYMRNGVIRRVGEMRSTVGQNINIIANTLGTGSAKGRDELRSNFKSAVHWIRKHMSDGKGLTREGTREMARLMRVYSGRGRDAFKGNIDDLVDIIASTMSEGGKTTEAGLEVIQSLFRTALKSYGVDPDKILRIGTTPGTTLKPLQTLGTKPLKPINKLRGKAKGGFTQFGRPGQRGTDTIPARFGQTDVRVAPGEVATVWNRHQLPEADARFADWGGLAGFFAKNRRPHYLARGGSIARIPVVGRQSSALRGVVQGGMDIARQEANKKIAAAKRRYDEAQASRGPSGKPTGVKGVVSYAGLPFGIAKWVLGALNHARKKGVAPTPTSGYRPHWYNVMQGRTYRSEHEGTQYPHGAVDFGGFTTGYEAAQSVIAATADYKYPLISYISSFDKGHTSGTGHARGGFISAARGRHGRRRHSLSYYNRVFPEHGLGQPGTFVGTRDIRRIFEAAGATPLEARRFAWISRGESGGGQKGGYPGIRGDDPRGTKGWGFVQNTPGVWDKNSNAYKLMMRLGGVKALRNPIKGAKVALSLLHEGGWGNWAGTKYWHQAMATTSAKSVLSKADRREMRGGKRGRAPRKKRRFQRFTPAGPGAFVGGPDPGGRALGKGKGKGKGGAALPGLGGMSLADALAYNDLAMAQAEGTPTKADDIAVRQKRIGLLQMKGLRIQGKIKSISRQLRGKLTKKRRRSLAERRRTLVGDLTGVTSDITSLGGEIRDLQAPADTSDTGGGADAAAELQRIREELQGLRADQKTQGARSEALIRTQGPQLTAALVALVNGGIGGQIQRRLSTPAAAGRASIL